eukprot:7655945-Karenia_brevis.AAC.1
MDGPYPKWMTCAHGAKLEAAYAVLAGWNNKDGGLKASEDKTYEGQRITWRLITPGFAFCFQTIAT